MERVEVLFVQSDMPWFGSGTSVKFGKNRGTYRAAEDGRSKRRGARSRPNDSGHGQAPPAGILKRSGRPARTMAFPFENGMVPQEMAAAVPMPCEQTVNTMFTEMVVSS